MFIWQIKRYLCSSIPYSHGNYANVDVLYTHLLVDSKIAFGLRFDKTNEFAYWLSAFTCRIVRRIVLNILAECYSVYYQPRYLNAKCWTIHIADAHWFPSRTIISYPPPVSTMAAHTFSELCKKSLWPLLSPSSLFVQ